MNEIRVLDKTGDSKIMWDVDNQDEVDAAKAQFDLLIEKGFQAYRVKKDGEKGAKIKKFNPEAGRIIMVPEIKGG